MIEGLIARQAECVLRDAYANAFNREPSDDKPFDDFPRASDWVWECKYEIDSLCYPIWLAEKYLTRTRSKAFLTERFALALRRIVDVLHLEQRHEQSEYLFVRTNCPPSDDACKYGYLVPSNLFAVRVLKGAQKLAKEQGDNALAAEFAALRAEIAAGVEGYARVQHPQFGDIYAYEVDGLGHANLMDDANVPSLLALPYLEVCSKDDPLYQRTRRFVLSQENPYYKQGKMAKGVGSPHTPAGYIWPIALCVQAMTWADNEEAAGILHALMNTHAGTGFMHESFDPNAPEKFTRGWFAWANSMFDEMIHRLADENRLDEVLRLARAM